MWRNNKGVTLVELLVVVALIGIVLVGAVNIYLVGTRSFNTGVDKATSQQDARFVTNEITNELKYAKKLKTTPFIITGSEVYYRMTLSAGVLIIDSYSLNMDDDLVETRVFTIGEGIKHVEFYGTQFSSILTVGVESESNFTGIANRQQGYAVETSIRLLNQRSGANNVIEESGGITTIVDGELSPVATVYYTKY